MSLGTGINFLFRRNVFIFILFTFALLLIAFRFSQKETLKSTKLHTSAMFVVINGNMNSVMCDDFHIKCMKIIVTDLISSCSQEHDVKQSFTVYNMGVAILHNNFTITNKERVTKFLVTTCTRV